MSCEVCRLGCCVLAESISFAHGGILITCVLSMDCVCHEQATIHKNCLPDRSRYSSNVSRVPFQFIWSQRLFGAIVVRDVEVAEQTVRSLVRVSLPNYCHDSLNVQ